MKTKLGYAIVGMVVTLAAIGIPTLNIHRSSAVEEDSFANQNDRQDRFEDRFEDPENPNNDKGNIELWTNSFKNIDKNIESC
jgi:hypothetical protein